MMQKHLLSLSLVLICTAANAQRPDSPGRRSEHIPSTAGSAAASVQGQSLGRANISGQSSARSERGMSQGSQRGKVDIGSSSVRAEGRQSMSLERSKSEHGRGDDTDTTTGSPDRERSGRGKNILKNENAIKVHLTGQQRALQVQLAAVDRMRDKAVETGNQDMLDKADQLEMRVRERFAGVTLPEEQPMGDETTPDDLLGKASADAAARGNAKANTNALFGKSVSSQARANGRAFGEVTSDEASSEGRAFGKANADKTRFEAPPSEPIEDEGTGTDENSDRDDGQ